MHWYRTNTPIDYALAAGEIASMQTSDRQTLESSQTPLSKESSGTISRHNTAAQSDGASPPATGNKHRVLRMSARDFCLCSLVLELLAGMTLAGMTLCMHYAYVRCNVNKNNGRIFVNILLSELQGYTKIIER